MYNGTGKKVSNFHHYGNWGTVFNPDIKFIFENASKLANFEDVPCSIKNDHFIFDIYQMRHIRPLTFITETVTCDFVTERKNQSRSSRE